MSEHIGDILTPSEAARIALCAGTSIYRAIYSGELEATIDGGRYFVTPEALRQWMARPDRLLTPRLRAAGIQKSDFYLS